MHYNVENQNARRTQLNQNKLKLERKIDGYVCQHIGMCVCVYVSYVSRNKELKEHR